MQTAGYIGHFLWKCVSHPESKWSATFLNSDGVDQGVAWRCPIRIYTLFHLQYRYLRRWLGPILGELDVPRTLVGGWFAASSAGCLLSIPEGEPNYRYIEVGLES